MQVKAPLSEVNAPCALHCSCHFQVPHSPVSPVVTISLQLSKLWIPVQGVWWLGEISRTGWSTVEGDTGNGNPDPNQPRRETFLLSLPIAIVQISYILTKFWNLMLSNWPQERGTAHMSATHCKRKSASNSSLECGVQRSRHSIQVNHPASIILVPVTCKTKPGSSSQETCT